MGTSKSDGGFAAVDALMALLILSISLTLGLKAVEQGAKLAKRAEALENAKALAATLEGQHAKPSGEARGVAQGYDWSIAWRSEAQDVPPPRLCWRDIALMNRADGRRYHFSRAMICPDTAASPTGAA